jgi:outer membrane protein OmpA-like peptidoglycan-associated protein
MAVARSQLHLQLGQEVIYVLMTLGIMVSLLLIASNFRERPPAPPLPDCALPGHGPCFSAVDLPECMHPGLGPCLSPNDRPPILNLTEREGFRFDTASYVVNEAFKERLRSSIAPEIVRISTEYNANVVEVVGHTDSVPVRVPTSSLDRKLNAYLSGNESAAEVADNVGLGMMRAASVVRALREIPELERHEFVFLAMSAGQTIAPNEQLVGLESGKPTGDEARRRVEIRLRRSLYKP